MENYQDLGDQKSDYETLIRLRNSFDSVQPILLSFNTFVAVSGRITPSTSM